MNSETALTSDEVRFKVENLQSVVDLEWKEERLHHGWSEVRSGHVELTQLRVLAQCRKKTRHHLRVQILDVIQIEHR